MNTRPLSSSESANLAVLNASGCNSVLLFVTATGLGKGILDATEPMRRLLNETGIHDYAIQGKGPENKLIKPTIILDGESIEKTNVSLYRPTTKNGDPRLWFSNFNRFASAGDVCAVFVWNGNVHLLNLTRSPAAEALAEGRKTPATQFLQGLKQATDTIANELLGLLKALAAEGPLKAVCEGDTAIGRSIETALGIRINSKRAPDYKGIELKSGRSGLVGHENRATLFACVPDWSLSRCKSSTQILSEFGYEREGEFKLYCEVSTRRPNSQGLIFQIDEAKRWLEEVCRKKTDLDVAIWRLEHLENRLSEKHPETFWIKAQSSWRGTEEWFELVSIIHTKNPNVPQFERLLSDGTITMDHLIKRTPTGRGQEKGPLFKIEKPRLHELFLGEPRNYSLVP